MVLNTGTRAQDSARNSSLSLRRNRHETRLRHTRHTTDAFRVHSSLRASSWLDIDINIKGRYSDKILRPTAAGKKNITMACVLGSLWR
jgi:hypothetical protein